VNSNSEASFHAWSPAGCLQVIGDDALTFLQGQFTNDLHQVDSKEAKYGLWLNQKGKVLADSFVRTVSDTEAWIVSYFSTAAVIRERLEAYIIADDVTIEDVTAATKGVSILGADARANLDLPASAWSFRGRRLSATNTEIIFPASEAAALNARFATGSALSPQQMERLRIMAGIPAVPVDIGPQDLPNEGGLEGDAISYTKGCYLGQEVMARLKSMGQVRRRLLRVKGRGAFPAKPAPVFQGERKVGELRSAVREGADWIGLALVSLVNLRREEGLAFAAGGSAGIEMVDAP